MILDMFKKKEDATEPAKEEVKAAPKTPEQLEMEAKLHKRKQYLDKVDRILRQISQDKKDCYLVLAKDTTLDQLATKEHLRPLIAPMNPNQRIPVLRCATTEAVASDIARAFGCVCEERPLVSKISFIVLFNLISQLAKIGIFNYVITDGPDNYIDQASHIGYFNYAEVLKQDPKPYLQYMTLLESLHALRVTRTPFYVLPAPNTTEEELAQRTFRLGLVGAEKNMVCPVFTHPKIAVELMKRWKLPQKLVPITAEQLKVKLDDLQALTKATDYPVLFGGARSANTISGVRLRSLMDDIFKIQK